MKYAAVNTEAEPVISIAGLVKIYGRQRVIDNLTLQIGSGQVFGLLGPNGAGKSTLMKLISGLSRPTEGSVRVYGYESSERCPEMKRLIGLIPQDNNLERELNVREALTVYARMFGINNFRQRVDEIIERFCLQNMLGKKIRTLSGGMMRRVLIARALLPDPQLLLLDEPTVGLDPDVRNDLWNIVSGFVGEGRTVILTTHYMEEAERLCANIAMMKQGRLALLDTPEGIQRRFGGHGSKTENLEALFIRLAKEKS